MTEATEQTEAAAPDATAHARPVSAHGEPLPHTATTLAEKAKDLQALRDALADAASVGIGLWFSYIFLLFYLLIAAGGVTHRDLLFENPVKLPFLNVDLPLLGFFVLGPAIFLVVHAYVLLHLVLLAGKVGYFDAELRAQIIDAEVRGRLRRQLPSNIFVQFLAGPREVRSGVLGFMLQLIAQISLVLGPIALLVFFQFQFLPYHDVAITWWHRIAVAADTALIWILWPSIARSKTQWLAWRDLRRGKTVALAFVSLVPMLLVTVIATFPGEWVDDNLWTYGSNEPWRQRLTSLHELLVAGDVDLAARKPKSVWSNRLVLPGIEVIDRTKLDGEAKIAAIPGTVSLRSRHLEGAVLIGAKLRNVDFTAARLQGAQLGDADLRNAKFECADPSFDAQPPQCAQLQGANLWHAQLQGASLAKAHLEGALLSFAQLQGASLDGAHLEGASLAHTQLQGASLVESQLQGAFLSFAQLEGASLDHAQLEGASLDRAQLEGASLDHAQLEGASLDHAQLQGASLYQTQFAGASLDGAFVWRADGRNAIWLHTRIANLETGPKYVCMRKDRPSTCDWSPESFDKLKQLIAERVPDGRLRDAMQRIAPRLDPKKSLDNEYPMRVAWGSAARGSPATDEYERQLTPLWRGVGCNPAWAPYVLHKFAIRLVSGVYSPFGAGSPRRQELAAALLDPGSCPGTHALSGDEKAKLEQLRDHPSPPPQGH
jgi:uncharacterized protein YjbI with pentapeptide repeats